MFKKCNINIHIEFNVSLLIVRLNFLPVHLSSLFHQQILPQQTSNLFSFVVQKCKLVSIFRMFADLLKLICIWTGKKRLHARKPAAMLNFVVVRLVFTGRQ
ncbi:hypothetical protein T4C_6257 [Trichinella pseudospiralis]|uniref:Uncharacterized protein n=1 Tax=Trichinella pseudospiralis TaxID=6337 RepID=A0A0V1J4I7_TRIPS|nr:hypothetical protein T4D_9151 [Trichinella pseudospiralis]KRZ29874.1 hypothetical protein T4C_6257 [Trichinella pseudospiralis]